MEGPVGVGRYGKGGLGFGGRHPAVEEAAGRAVRGGGEGRAALQVRQGLQGSAGQLDIDRRVIEILDNDGVVVIQEEADLGGTLQVEVQVPAHQPADFVQHRGREVIQIAEIIGDGQHVQVPLGIQGAVEDGPAGNAAGERTARADHLPAVVRQILDLRDENVLIRLPVPAEVIDQGLVIRAAELADFGDLLRDGLEQARGDEHVAAFLELLADFGGETGIRRGLARQQDGLPAFREGGEHVHGKADHAQVVLQEFLARGVEDLIGLDTDRLSELAHQVVRLAEHHVGDARHGGRRHGLPALADRGGHLVIVPAGGAVLPGGPEARVQLHAQQLAVVEEHHVARFGDGREEELFGIAVHAHIDAAGVHPAAPVAPSGDVLEIAHDVVAEVVLQMLVAARVAGFRAGPDPVEDLRPAFQVEPQPLEMVIPVGVLDDDLDLGVDGLRGAHDEVAPGFVHQLQAVLRPAAVALRGDFHVLLAAGEEEIVQEELVKVLRGVFRDALDPGAVFRIGVAESFEVVGLVDGIGDARGDLQALFEEEGLRLFEGGVIHELHVAVGLEVDLVHVQLVGDGFPGGFEPLRVRHLFDFVRADVHGYFEILVSGQERYCAEQRQDAGGEHADRVFHGYCYRCVAKIAKAVRSKCLVPQAIRCAFVPNEGSFCDQNAPGIRLFPVRGTNGTVVFRNLSIFAGRSVPVLCENHRSDSS